MKNQQYRQSSTLSCEQFKKRFREQVTSYERQPLRLTYHENPSGDTFVLQTGIFKLKGHIRDIPGKGSEIVWEFTKQLMLKIVLAVPFIAMVFAIAYYLITKNYPFAFGLMAAAMVYICLASLFLLYIPKKDRQRLTEQLEILSDHKEA